MKQLVISIRFICFTVLLSSIGVQLAAQQQKIDSLKHRLQDASAKDSLSIATALVTIYGNETDDNTSALQFAKLANAMSWKLGDSLAIVTSGRRMGQLYNRLNDVDAQLSISEEILPIATRNKFEGERGKILNVIGAAHADRGKYDSALQLFFESLVIEEKEGDQKAIAVTSFNIGYLYYKIYDNDRAIKYYDYALKIKNKIFDSWKTESLLLNLSLCYSSKHDFEKSKKYIDQVKELCLKKNCPRSTKLELEVTEGLHFLRSNCLLEAEECFSRGLPLARIEQNTRLGLDCILNLSKIFIKQGKVDLAIKYLNEAEKSGEIGGFNNELLQLYTQLSEVYKEVNNYKMMAYYQNQYIHLKDSISGDDVRNNLMRVQADYLERENEARIKSQAELLTLQDEVIDRQLIVQKLVVAVVILLMLLAYVLFLLNRNKRMVNALLDKKVEEQTRELEISYRELKVTAEKRDAALRKAAREILSSMTTVKGLCSTGLKDVNKSSSIQTLTDIGNASDRIRDSVNTILE